MKKFLVTIVKSTTFEMEASDEAAARKEAEWELDDSGNRRDWDEESQWRIVSMDPR